MRVFKIVTSLLLICVLCVGVYLFAKHKQDDPTSHTASKTTNSEKEVGSNKVNDKTEEKVSNENENVTNSEPTNENSLGETDTTLPNTSENGELPKLDDVFVSSLDNIAFLVNQDFALSADYEPNDLVYPDVRFTFEEKLDKRKLRKEAAEALEKMFEAAEVDGIYLAGVSGYRSHATQTQLFNYYVERDGLEKAKTYSAEPGTSEHQTGLAIDISGSTGKCAAQDCFAGTAEAIWLEENGPTYGFIVRYPKDKEHITGYKYEPWHMRYVGDEVAKYVSENELTLEEYYGKN